MPRKRDTAFDRIKNHIEVENNWLAPMFGIGNDFVALGSCYQAAMEGKKWDWNNLKLRSIAAHHALTIDERDVALKHAFDRFGLDGRNPFHWRKLIFYLSDAVFRTAKRPGPRQKWSDDQLCMLLRDFDRIKRRHRTLPGSKVADLKLCGILKNDSKLRTRYQAFSEKTILRNLQRARNPDQNKSLGKLASNVAEPLIDELRVAFKAKNAKLDAKWEALIRSSTIVSMIKALSEGDNGGSRKM